MIEVEKKFILKEGDEEKIKQGAEFIADKTFTDTYFDSKEYALTKQDIWVRERDGKFELKIPMNVPIEERVSDQYQEVETEKEIAEFLKLTPDIDLREALKEKGYEPFCTVTTIRKKYKKDGFIFDIDTVDYGYELAEIEYMVQDISEVKEATDKIIAYARKLGLTEGIVRGKVVEYLRRNNPEHFQALINVKVLK